MKSLVLLLLILIVSASLISDCGLNYNYNRKHENFQELHDISDYDENDYKGDLITDNADDTSFYDIKYDENNLKGYDRDTGRSNIDIVFEKIEYYPKNCTEFVFKERVGDFLFVSEEILSNEINAYYQKDSVPREQFDVRIVVKLYDTQEKALQSFKEKLEYSSALFVRQSTIEIGDLALGGEEYFMFIRGNVYAEFIGNKDISVIILAKEIDQQILAMLIG